MCGLGNRKNEDFLKALAEVGVEPYRSTLDLIGQLRAAGLGVALITSSRNAAAVLGSAGVDPAVFGAVVDGNESARLGLPGKPDPAIFLAAASELEVEPAAAVVVEDAVSRGGGRPGRWIRRCHRHRPGKQPGRSGGGRRRCCRG